MDDVSDDLRDEEIGALRKQITGLAVAAEVDPKDAELAWLRSLKKLLADAVVRSTEPPKPQQWVALPGGQCIPAELLVGGYPALHAAGFRWDGNKPVFPEAWPNVKPDSPSKRTARVQQAR